MDDTWQVYAIKYAERTNRIRAESFLADDNHDVAHPIFFYFWVLRNGSRSIIVDTGFDEREASARKRPVISTPDQALRIFGQDAENVETLILTHLHFDHAGGLHFFPNARVWLQASEIQYATGPGMCHEPLRAHYTADHVCEFIKALYSDRVIFADGDAAIADGVTIHRIGGHSRGLQAVRVKTENGWLCLASDAAHFYENAFRRKPFPIVVDVEDMLDGFSKVCELASAPQLVVPGHDPLVAQLFPSVGDSTTVFRLDKGPIDPEFDVFQNLTWR